MVNAHDEITHIVHQVYKCYPAKDRATLESLLGADFHFTSPLDNRIDRKTYFERCWPNSETMAALDLDRVVVTGEHAYVTYEVRTVSGKRFRNTELLNVSHGKVVDVEVYFGWPIPHGAPVGKFVAT